MKLWKATWCDVADGCIVSWHASERSAATRINLARREEEAKGPMGIQPVEVPTRKAELIAWLNENCNRDNG